MALFMWTVEHLLAIACYVCVDIDSDGADGPLPTDGAAVGAVDGILTLAVPLKTGGSRGCGSRGRGVHRQVRSLFVLGI